MPWPRRAAAALLIVALALQPAQAVRTNASKDVKRLMDTGQYEELLFFLRSTLDMVMALHVAWSGAPYDPAMDGLYREIDRIYTPVPKGRRSGGEVRVDRRYWGIIHNQRQAIAEVLEKAKLTDAQLDKLDTRVRVYVEHHMAPEFDEMGDFYFQRKAWLFERTGLFYDASFRRRLTGYYDERVCAPYYATMATELAAKGKPQAEGYRRKAEWYRAEALREFRRSNGDRLLSLLQQGKTRERYTRDQVLGFLKAGLKSAEADARFAAALILADMGETALLGPVANDPDDEIRESVAALLQAPTAPGLGPGIAVEYCRDPAGLKPVSRKVMPNVDVGFKGNDRFLEILTRPWEKAEAVPADASGPFLLKFRGKLQVPEDGRYRLYVKTPPGARAVVRIGAAGGQLATAIAPENDKQLLYVEQLQWGGGYLYRIDFCEPIALKKGLADLEIDYSGGNVRDRFGPASIQLFWSSDAHVMEIVPARALWHAGG